MPIRDAITVALAAPVLTWRERLRWFSAFRRWQQRADADPASSFEGVPDVTAIVLSYKRPQNIRPIVRSLLSVPQIGRILVSNNNSHTVLPPMLGLGDARVRVIQQAIDAPTNRRFTLALADGAPYFLFVDDDVFLTPGQIDRLLLALRKEPGVPHGVTGQIYDAWMDRTHNNVCDHEGPLDILNCVYALTRDHVLEFFRIAEGIGCVPGTPLWGTSIWDDIVLSHAGKGRPKTHRLGDMLRCPTSATRGIAVFTGDQFFRNRVTLFRKIRALKPL